MSLIGSYYRARMMIWRMIGSLRLARKLYAFTARIDRAITRPERDAAIGSDEAPAIQRLDDGDGSVIQISGGDMEGTIGAAIAHRPKDEIEVIVFIDDGVGRSVTAGCSRIRLRAILDALTKELHHAAGDS